MGAAASLLSSSTGTQHVKVEILASSGEPRFTDIRIDNIGAVIGCSSKVIEASADSDEPVGSELADAFERISGIGHIARYAFADKSSSQVLVARALEDEDFYAAAADAGAAVAVLAGAGGGGGGAAKLAPFYLVPHPEPFSRISGICKVRRQELAVVVPMGWGVWGGCVSSRALTSGTLLLSWTLL